MKQNIQTQFLLWFVLLAVLPLAVFAAATYANVKTNVETDVQNALAFDLGQAKFSMDEKWSNYHRYVQIVMNSQELYDVFSTMDRSVKRGEYHTAQFYGMYSLDTQLKSLFATERNIAAAMVIIDGRCVYTYNNFVTVNRSFDTDSLYEMIAGTSHTVWMSDVEKPFGAFEGRYTVIARNIKDVFAGKPMETICTFVLLVDQGTISQGLEEFARYPGSVVAISNGDGQLIATNTPDGQEMPALDRLFGEHAMMATSISAAFWEDYYAVWSRSANSGWNYVLLTPRAYITATSSGIIRLAIVLGAFLCVMLALFLLLVSRTIIGPIKRLAEAMGQVGLNNFELSVESKAKNEIGDVSRGFNQMVQDIRELFALSIEKEEQKRDYQIAMLKYQINPHFIYNTLNSIRFSALRHEDEETAGMLVIMSRLLRSTLSNVSILIPFYQELENIRDFLTLQQVRYSNALHVEYEIGSEVVSALVPSMVLQPIVENAIAHGLSDKLNNGELAQLRIMASAEGDELLLCVWDNGGGIAPDRREMLLTEQEPVDSGKKIGLANIHNRIRLLVGDAYGLHVDSQQGTYTSVYINLPLKWETETDGP